MIDQLMALFADWRAFEAAPLLSDGVPDYRAPTLQDKKNRLPAFQERLTSLTPADWPVAQQIDHRILRAEMNGLETPSDGKPKQEKRTLADYGFIPPPPKPAPAV